MSKRSGLDKGLLTPAELARLAELAGEERAGALRREGREEPRAGERRAALDPAAAGRCRQENETPGLRGHRARALPLSHQLPRRVAEGLPRPRARRLVPRGLPHP